jgi:hypothetical protein
MKGNFFIPLFLQQHFGFGDTKYLGCSITGTGGGEYTTT